MRLFLTGGALPQREQIIIRYETGLHGIPSCRIGTSSLHKGALFHAPSMNYPRETIVSLNAARLVIKSVILVALPGELLLGGPRPRPHGRIISCHGVFERRRSGPCPTLHQMQVLPRPLEIGLGTEVRHVDHERIALPVAARVAIPLADIGRQMEAPVPGNITFPLAPVVQ